MKPPLDYGTAGGRPFLKIDARAGVLKVPVGKSDVALTKLKLEVDFDSTETGWLAFPKDQAPQLVPGVDKPKPDPAR